MTDRPILFSAPMVRAILDDSKNQTRRVLKPQPVAYQFPTGPAFSWGTFHGEWPDDWFGYGGEIDRKLPYAPGDRLWVKEEYYQAGHWYQPPGALTKGGRPKWQFVPADHSISFGLQHFLKSRSKRRPEDIFYYKRIGRFMPRRYSRITLIVTDVRVERLQDISRGDAMDEGCPFANIADGPDPRDWYRALWDSLNGDKPGCAWEANPWVTALTFTAHQCNIDQMENPNAE